MENIKGSTNTRNATSTGKPSYLPPKIPFPGVSPSFADFTPKGFSNPKEANNPHHQRTSSESVLLEESPSWLDDLLNEPDTPVRKGGHRRSSSDSFAYIDVSNSSITGYKNKNLNSVPSWGSQDFERYKDGQHSFFPEPNSKLQNWGVDTSSASQGASGVSSTGLQKQKSVDSVLNDTKSNSEMRDSSNAKAYGSDYDTKSSNAKSYASDSDTKRAKQQFAQRSRVRKLQYIVELERNVQALQAEGSEISAELEFVNQQNLILNMENQTLKQRLDSLAQEQMIKYMEQEMLEREVGRLRTICHQLQHHQQHQQQQQQTPSSSLRRTNSRDFNSQHRRNKSKDLDSQFTNLSLKQ